MNSKENETASEETTNQEEQKSTDETSIASEINPLEEKEKEIAELKLKVAELNDKFLRLYSEFDNFKRRTQKEKLDLIQSGGEEIFKSILPVLDDFERAIKSNAETIDITAVNDGVNLIYNKLKSTLTQKGLEEMKSQGEVFNADIHEAITNIPAASDDMKGKVIEEMEKGYSLNGKIIRFAKVIIGN